MPHSCLVTLICAILYSNDDELKASITELEKIFGSIETVSKKYLFDVTNYYEKEMGQNLYRKIISFQNLVNASDLHLHKHKCKNIEEKFKDGKNRKINLDPGYIDHDKVVLSSFKSGPYKIYFQKNVWADMILHYEKGIFHSFTWSFADFKDKRYDKDFLKIRNMYKKKLRTKTNNNFGANTGI